MHNKIILIGNTGKDMELKTFDSGDTIGSFSLATNKSYKDKNGEWQKVTQWHNVQVRGKYVSQLASRITKGALVLVEGELKYRTYEKDGQKRIIAFIDTMMVRPMEKKDSSQNSYAGAANVSTPPASAIQEPEDNLPF